MEALYQGQLSSLPSSWKVHKLCVNSGIELPCSRGTSAVGTCVCIYMLLSLGVCMHYFPPVCGSNCMPVTPKPNESGYDTNEELKVSMFPAVLTDSCWFQR